MRPRREAEVVEVIAPTVGYAEVCEGDASSVSGVLWVPDPEGRRGWREYYVRREAKPGARPMGFRR